jgi:hypothetical protein
MPVAGSGDVRGRGEAQLGPACHRHVRWHARDLVDIDEDGPPAETPIEDELVT